MDEPDLCNPEIALKNEDVQVCEDNGNNNADGKEIYEPTEETSKRCIRPR